MPISFKTPPSAIALLISLFFAGCGGGGSEAPPEPAIGAASINVLSSKKELVSGGDAAIEVTLPDDVTVSQVKVMRNGADVTPSLVSATGTLRGVVEGLAEGQNQIEVQLSATGRKLGEVSLRNAPKSGPTVSGPHQRPWICETEASGLGAPPATGPCQVASKYEWFYKNAAGNFVALTSLAKPFPADLTQTTTIDGKSVDYIVRVESGTIAESIYRIAILDDPTNPISKPWSSTGTKPGNGWNGKLYMHFTGGSGPAYRSGRNTATAPMSLSDSIINNRDDPLALGFAVAFGTRNTFGTGQNDAVSAETASMIKEHFIENYGVPRFTIGLGPSGASMQLHLIAQNYPGVLDGIIPDRTFPDQMSILADVLDCRLLSNYFANKAAAPWTLAKISKVDGYPVIGTTTLCNSGWGGFASNWHDPTRGFDSVVTVSVRYNPATNPTGVRGDIFTSNVNAYGINPTTGFARSAYDNVGVQYGLQALNSGAISVAEFLDLNEKVGGLDADGNIIAQRSSGDPIAIANSYKSGRINMGVNLTLPIIDYRSYRDDAIDVHTRHRTFAKMERMIKTNGTRDNMAVWTIPSGAPNNPNLIRLGVTVMNEWLEAFIADKSPKTYQARVIAARPATAKDACWDNTGRRIDEPATLAGTLSGEGTCAQLYPIYADPRLVAGSPRSAEILKCQLKPVSAGDYKVSLTADELARLNAIFPSGVCDWAKPGVSQSAPDGSWIVFGSTPGTWSVLGN